MEKLFPSLYNFADITLIDIIQIVLSVILGVAAIWAACAANRLSKKTIKLTTESQLHEEKMRALEVDITLFDKRIEIFIMLEMTIHTLPSRISDKNLAHSIKNKTEYLFPEYIRLDIINYVNTLFNYVNTNMIPASILIAHEKDERYIEQEKPIEKVKYCLLEELYALRQKCESFLYISKNSR